MHICRHLFLWASKIKVKTTLVIPAFVFLKFLLSSNVIAQDLNSKNLNQNVSLTTEEINWISQHPVLRVSNSAKWPPIDFVSAGQPSGFAVDYMRLIASKVGLNVQFINGPEWENTILKLQTRELDVINTLSFTEERSEFFNFTQSYIDLPIVHYARGGNITLNRPEDLKGKIIGVQDEHIIAQSYMRLYPNQEYKYYEDSISALQALSEGEIDIYSDDKEIIEFSISQFNIPGLIEFKADFLLDLELIDQRFAVHKEDTILLNILNKGMTFVTSQEYFGLVQKWIGQRRGEASNDLTQEEKKWLSENNVIKVVADPSTAPLEFIDENGLIAGVSSAYLKDIADQLNVEFIWANNRTWKDGLDKIRAKEAELVSTITPTRDREKILSFSDPIFSAPLVIFSNSERVNYSSLDALNGKLLALVQDYAINDLIKSDYPDIQIIEFGTLDEAIKSVSTGDTDAYVGNIPVTNHALANNGIRNINVTGTTHYSSQTSIGIRSDLPLLASAINKSLRNIPHERRQTYLSDSLTTVVSAPVDYGPLQMVIAISFIVAIIILYWNRRLRGEIKRRMLVESQLLKASKAKSDFLASMSHELRTPLNAIIGFSETIKSELFGPINNKKYCEYNQNIFEAGKFLLGLVEEILDHSALEANKKALNYESVPIADVINEYKVLVENQAKKKGIILSVTKDNLPKCINTDRKALVQILVNLVSNAIKFSPSNSQVETQFSCDNSTLYIKVVDDGPGIAIEKIDTITDPFTKSQDSPYVTQNEGTGLGLAIVKSLIDLLGGNIKFVNHKYSGMTVSVSLPLKNY